MNRMSKSDWAKQLAAAVEEYQQAGGEIVRHASPSNPTPIKLGAPAVKVANLRDEEWQKFIGELQAGTYCPDTEFQERQPKKRLTRRTGGEDFRGWKNQKGHGPSWRE